MRISDWSSDVCSSDLIVHFIGGGNAPLSSGQDDYFEVAGRRFRSRLLVGTGKYKDFEETRLAIEASGAEIVTVAVRRVNVTDRNQPMSSEERRVGKECVSTGRSRW